MGRSQPTAAAWPSAPLEPLAGPALIVDPEYRVRATNAALRLRLSRCEEPVGVHCFELLHGRRRPCASLEKPCPVDACRASGRAVLATHLHGTGRSRRRERVLLRPIFDDAHAVVACLATLQPDDAGPRYLPARCETSIAIAPVRRQLVRLARSACPLLLLGEPGTGKARVARAMHRLAGRRAPFEERNGCELGAGALTALWSERARHAETGTLYLADVDSLDPPAQAALLAVSQRPAGGWRLVAGTSRDLDRAAAGGLFRRDLLSRLSRHSLRLPPLRERRAELPRIATALLQEGGGRGRVLAVEALERLASYAFPGNLDELAHVLRYANLMAEGAIVRVRDLPAWLEARGDGKAKA